MTTEEQDPAAPGLRWCVTDYEEEPPFVIIQQWFSDMPKSTEQYIITVRNPYKLYRSLSEKVFVGECPWVKNDE